MIEYRLRRVGNSPLGLERCRFQIIPISTGKLAGSIFQLSFHGITGALAVLLMLIHAIWATTVHASKRPEPKTQFHKFSVLVRAIWLVPYISGLIFGVSR